LDRSDAVAQTESDTLRLRANANVASELAVIVVLLFNRDIHQGIFTKDTFSQKLKGKRVSHNNNQECIDNTMPWSGRA
jgi:hypothetical protein